MKYDDIQFGSSVRVTKIPPGTTIYEGAVGRCYRVARPSPEHAWCACMLQREADYLHVHHDQLSQWQWETCYMGGPTVATDPIIEAAREFTPERPTKPSIRQRVDYEAFGEDLELAINHVRSVALGEHRREFSQPSLMGSVPMERAMYLVCLSLIERKLGADFERYLDQVLDDARVLLISKNRAYGDSALNPVRVFSKASLKEQLLVRLDDKVSRLARGQAAGEDVAADLLGYLLLVIIADKRERG